MRNDTYLLNSRFLVDRQVHSVKDISTGAEHHLEPRLMEVLVALLNTPGTLVARETLIRDVWNDYAGADEGLTQAISSLRKLLEDDTKDIIKTVPKKGYMLMAPVVKQDHAPVMGAARSRRNVYYALAAGLVIAATFSLWLFSHADDPARATQTKQQTTEVEFPGTEETDESNYLNTITTTDPAGNTYRLVMIGDRRPKFYVNDTLQADTERYTALVDKLAKELWKRQGEAAEREK